MANQIPFDDEEIKSDPDEHIVEAVHRILVSIGEDPDREGLAQTPKRVAQMYAELTAGYHADPDTLAPRQRTDAHAPILDEQPITAQIRAIVGKRDSHRDGQVAGAVGPITLDAQCRAARIRHRIIERRGAVGIDIAEVDEARVDRARLHVQERPGGDRQLAASAPGR